MSKAIRIGVLGAGTWGAALARLLQNKGHSVTVWSAVEAEIEHLCSKGYHPNLPDARLPDQIIYTKDISIACKEQDMIVFASPRLTCARLHKKPHRTSRKARSS